MLVGVLNLILALTLVSGAIAAADDVLTPVGYVDQFGSTPAPDPRFDELTAFMARARRGGVLKLSWNEAIPSVFPSAIRDGDFKPRAPNVDQFIYETLMAADPRFETHTVYPLVAKGVSATADFCRFAVELRDDVTFSDGARLTTADVQRSTDAFFREYFSGAMTELMKSLFGEFHLDVVDPLHFTVRLEKLNPALCRQGAYYFLNGIPLVKENPRPEFKDAIKMPYLGTGPYRATDVSRMLIRLRRRTEYWGEDHPLRAKTFNPEVIETLVVLDQTLERFAILRGDVNLMREKSFTLDAWMAEHADGKHPYSRLDQRTDAMGSDVGAVWMNQRRPDTGDRNFRRALVLAWDVSRAANEFFAGRRSALSEPGQLSELKPSGRPSPAVRALLNQAGPDDPEVRDALRSSERLEYARLGAPKSRRQRLHLAMEWLEDSGYVLTRVGRTTRLTKNGRPVELTAAWLLGSIESRLLLQFQSELRYLGITLNFRVYPDRTSLVGALQDNIHDLYPSSTEIARDFHVLNSNYLLWELHSRNRDKLGAWGRVNSKVLDVTLAALETSTPGTPEYRVIIDAFLRAFSRERPRAIQRRGRPGRDLPRERRSRVA